MLSVILLVVAPSSAAACTAPIWGRPYDPASATLVAEGRIESLLLRTDLRHQFAFMPLDIVIRTEAAFKGQVPNPLVFREAASLVAEVDVFGNVLAQQWAGSSGACGLFDADPTGTYVLVALRAAADPSSPGMVQTIAFGTGPNDPWITQLRQEVQSYPSQGEPPRIVTGATSGVILGAGFISRAGSRLAPPRLPVALGGAGAVLSLIAVGRVLRGRQRRR
jgi:hypothetical protein